MLFFFAEYDHVLSLEEQRKLAESTTEEVAIETNTAYGLRSEDVLSLKEQMKLAEEVAMEENAAYAEDQLQTEQVTMETNLADGLRSEDGLQQEQVTESALHFNSDPQQSPLPEDDSELGIMAIED